MPYRVQRRRIYILPTRFGLTLAALLLAMLVAGLNYGSNLALAFAFLIASLGIVAMHHCHRNLLELDVETGPTVDGFAQQSAILTFRVTNPSRFDRHDLEIHCGDADPAVFACPAGGTRNILIALPASTRGLQRLPQWELRTRFPFGWFRAWTYVQAPVDIYVAPAPRGQRPMPAKSGAGGDEEFAGLRTYQPGDALKHMAWKVVARGQDPAVRNYAQRMAEPEWLDWDALPGLEPELRLQQLCRWILDSDSLGRSFGLRIPGFTMPPANGPAHRSACLRALAAFI